MSPAYPRFGSTELAEHHFDIPLRLASASRTRNDAVESESDLTSKQKKKKKKRKKLGFLDLPLEIRTRIYHQLGFCTNHSRSLPTSDLVKDDVRVRCSYFFDSSKGGHDRKRLWTPLRPVVECSGVSTQIMRVCRQVAQDTYELLYEGTHFGITWDIAASRGYAGSGAVEEGNVHNFKQLPFSTPRFLDPCSLSFLTHVTVGPFRESSTSPKLPLDLGLHARTIEYLALRCTRLRYLGIHLPDKSEVTDFGQDAPRILAKALEIACRQCNLKQVWIGVKRCAREKLNMSILRAMTKPNNQKREMSKFDALLDYLKCRRAAECRRIRTKDMQCIKKHIEFEEYNKRILEWAPSAGQVGRKYLEDATNFAESLKHATAMIKTNSASVETPEISSGVRGSERVETRKPQDNTQAIIQKGVGPFTTSTQLHLLFCTHQGQKKLINDMIGFMHISHAVLIMEWIRRARPEQKTQAVTYLSGCFMKNRMNTHKKLVALIDKIKPKSNSNVLENAQENLQRYGEWLENGIDYGIHASPKKKLSWLIKKRNRKRGVSVDSSDLKLKDAEEAMVDHIRRVLTHQGFSKESMPPTGWTSNTRFWTSLTGPANLRPAILR